MEKEKIMEKENLILMEKKMKIKKNHQRINYYLKENILMEKEMEKEKNI